MLMHSLVCEYILCYILSCLFFCLVWFLVCYVSREISPHHQLAFDIIKKGENEDDIALVIGLCFDDV